jgi:hypothetical protein
MTHAEQRWIVAKVEQGMALVGALETQLARLPRHRREPPLHHRRRTHHRLRVWRIFWKRADGNWHRYQPCPQADSLTERRRYNAPASRLKKSCREHKKQFPVLVIQTGMGSSDVSDAIFLV